MGYVACGQTIQGLLIIASEGLNAEIHAGAFVLVKCKDHGLHEGRGVLLSPLAPYPYI